ncbi:UNVERIFIED_CONTAM: hypothetical protein Sradi_2847800 [Sesamum radiatum]|uniref:Pinin/SDK/MemA protein domain-containing protein n=1 Tax=Sesamum radiatum TaxID=300843 RepID=A0AAW2RWF2_SESRA
MGSTAVAEKTEEELRKEIDELYRQQREITERLRDPRGIRRGGLSGAGPRNFAANGGRQRGFVRPAERNDAEDQPPAKRRLSSAVVKVEDGEKAEEGSEAAIDVQKKDVASEIGENGNEDAGQGEKNPSNWSRRDGNQRSSKTDFEIPPAEHIPRVLPKNEDPSLVSRNKRMLGQLLGTLERFRKEDMQLSGTEAYMRRSDSLKRAEQRAREESEKLRQQEREQIAEKRKRDLNKIQLLTFFFMLLPVPMSDSQSTYRCKGRGKEVGIAVSSDQGRASNLLHVLQTSGSSNLTEQQKEQMFQEWKTARREELSQYQKQIAEQYVANVDKELERWQNGRKGRRANNDMANLQETMDKELETHQLEHGPKTRKIPGQDNNEDEDDVEDINVGEDDMMDDVLGVDDNRRVDETVKVEEAGNGSPIEEKKDE